MPEMVWGDWDYARLEYYTKHNVIPPELTKLDKKAYKLARKVRRARFGEASIYYGAETYALRKYNHAVVNYMAYIRFLHSNGFAGCNYYWREDLYSTQNGWEYFLGI